MNHQPNCQCKKCRFETALEISAKLLEELADGYSWYFNFRQIPGLVGSYGYPLTYGPASIGLLLRLFNQALKNKDHTASRFVKHTLKYFDYFSAMLSHGSNATFTFSFLNPNFPVALITGIATPVLGIPLALIFKDEQRTHSNEELPLLNSEPKASRRQWLREILDPPLQVCDFGGAAQLLLILLMYFGIVFNEWLNYSPLLIGVVYGALTCFFPYIKKFTHALAMEVYVFVILNILANDSYAKIWGDENIPDSIQYLTFVIAGLLALLPAWQGYREEKESQVKGLNFFKEQCASKKNNENSILLEVNKDPVKNSNSIFQFFKGCFGSKSKGSETLPTSLTSSLNTI